MTNYGSNRQKNEHETLMSLTYYGSKTRLSDRVGSYSQETGLRAKVIELLGAKCKICGFSDVRALQVDHINGGGSAEHRRWKARTIYRRILADPKNYQLLCANCNWIKRAENDEVNRRALCEVPPMKRGRPSMQKGGQTP